MKLLNMTSAEKIAYIMTRLYTNKLTTTSGGNLSIMDENGVEYVDATCPFVLKIHRLVEKYSKENQRWYC